MLLKSFYITIMTVALLLLHLIFFSTNASTSWDKNTSTSFECGFGFFTSIRNSFCIHYYTVALVFLIFDLEICTVLPYMSEQASSTSNMTLFLTLTDAMLVMLGGEWLWGKLNWTT